MPSTDFRDGNGTSRTLWHRLANTGERVFGRLLMAWDGSELREVLVDAAGRLSVDVNSASGDSTLSTISSTLSSILSELQTQTTHLANIASAAAGDTGAMNTLSVSSVDTAANTLSSAACNPNFPVLITIPPTMAGTVDLSDGSGTGFVLSASGVRVATFFGIENLNEITYQFSIGTGAPETIQVTYVSAS